MIMHIIIYIYSIIMYIYTIIYIWYKHITCIIRQKLYIYIHIHSWLHIQWPIYIYMITYVNMITHTHIFEYIYAFTYNTHTCLCTHLRVCTRGCSSLRLKWAIVVDPTYSTLQEDRDIHQNQDLTNPKWGVIMIHSTQSQSPRFGSLKTILPAPLLLQVVTWLCHK